MIRCVFICTFKPKKLQLSNLFLSKVIQKIPTRLHFLRWALVMFLNVRFFKRNRTKGKKELLTMARHKNSTNITTSINVIDSPSHEENDNCLSFSIDNDDEKIKPTRPVKNRKKKNKQSSTKANDVRSWQISNYYQFLLNL